MELKAVKQTELVVSWDHEMSMSLNCLFIHIDNEAKLVCLTSTVKFYNLELCMWKILLGRISYC